MTKEKDEYTWSREAIVNGELVTLTETGSSNPELRGMVRGSWYEVKYYADGTVRRVTEIKKDNGDTTVDANEFYANSSAPVGTYPKYVGLIDYVEKASDDNDTVVLYQDLTAQTYVVSVKGSTLQVDTTISTGSPRLRREPQRQDRPDSGQRDQQRQGDAHGRYL